MPELKSFNRIPPAILNASSDAATIAKGGVVQRARAVQQHSGTAHVSSRADATHRLLGGSVFRPRSARPFPRFR